MGEAFDATAARWLSFASDPDAHYDDIVRIDAADIEPTVTWGISPTTGFSFPKPSPIPPRPPQIRGRKATIEEALAYMKLPAGAPIKGVKIDVAFIGSCTNGRISDFREVAKYIQGHKVAPGVKAIAVPGSQIVAIQCEQEGLPKSSATPASNGAAPVARCAWP
jgi:3-isopropylmalate/(R)-2-methylmalate dehydratase large subunit